MALKQQSLTQNIFKKNLYLNMHLFIYLFIEKKKRWRAEKMLGQRLTIWQLEIRKYVTKHITLNYLHVYCANW